GKRGEPQQSHSRTPMRQHALRIGNNEDLPDRTAGTGDAHGPASALWARHAANRCQHDTETGTTDPCPVQKANAQNQHCWRRSGSGQSKASREKTCPYRNHCARTPSVCGSTGKGLRKAPYQIVDTYGESHGGEGETVVERQRFDEEAEGLARTHGSAADETCRQKDGQGKRQGNSKPRRGLPFPSSNSACRVHVHLPSCINDTILPIHLIQYGN